MVSLRREAPNTSEQRSRSSLCEGVIRREATEIEGLVLVIYMKLIILHIILGISGLDYPFYSHGKLVNPNILKFVYFFMTCKHSI